MRAARRAGTAVAKRITAAMRAEEAAKIEADDASRFPARNVRFVAAQAQIQPAAAGILQDLGQGNELRSPGKPEQKGDARTGDDRVRRGARRILALLPGLHRYVVARPSAQRLQRREHLPV